MSPIPKSKNVGTIMHFLKREKPAMPRKQKIAIALNTTRTAGNPIKRELRKRTFKK